MAKEFAMHRTDDGVYVFTADAAASWVSRYDRSVSVLLLPGGWRGDLGVWSPMVELFVWDEVDGGESPQYLYPLRDMTGLTVGRYNEVTGMSVHLTSIPRPAGVSEEFWTALPSHRVNQWNTEPPWGEYAWVEELYIWDEEG